MICSLKLKQLFVTNTQKKKWERAIVSKKEKKMQFPYVVEAQYEHPTAADTHLYLYSHRQKKLGHLFESP